MLKGRVREKERSPIYSPDGHNGQGCARPKPGGRIFFQVSRIGPGAQVLGTSSAAFP